MAGVTTEEAVRVGICAAIHIVAISSASGLRRCSEGRLPLAGLQHKIWRLIKVHVVGHT